MDRRGCVQHKIHLGPRGPTAEQRFNGSALLRLLSIDAAFYERNKLRAQAIITGISGLPLMTHDQAYL